MKTKKQIAILGGSFNPVTNGHIQIGEYVLAQSKIFDEVWLMPCFFHIYHKQMVDEKYRIKMCKIATRKDKRFKVFDYEIKNKNTNGTYSIIQKLLSEKKLTEKYDFSMVIGQDNANTFHYWIRHEELKQLIRFIVVPRKGIVADEKINWYLRPPHIYLTEECHIMEISSTKVRELISHEKMEELNAYIDPKVLDFIRKKELYNI